MDFLSSGVEGLNWWWCYARLKICSTMANLASGTTLSAGVNGVERIHSKLDSSQEFTLPNSMLMWTLTLSLLSSKCTFSQPFKEEMHKWGSENLYYNSFIWVSYEKPSSPYCVFVIFLVGLEGKFDIGHSQEWKDSHLLCYLFFHKEGKLC